MSTSKWPWVVLVAGVLLFVMGLSARDAESHPDGLSRMLFDAYIVTVYNNTETVQAASHIIAERGRHSGFWRQVLEELRKNNEADEGRCVDILGRMLETDALARDAIKREKETGRSGQWAASVCLGPEVMRELISRGEKADSTLAGRYAIALARARVPEAADFFQTVLQDDTGKYHYMGTAKFYAAVGLAQLGDPAGIAWLIAQSENRNLDIGDAYPRGVRHSKSDTYVTLALRQLTGQQNLTTRQEWEAWWERAGSKAYPKRRVEIMDLW